MKSEKIINMYNLVYTASGSGVALFTILELDSNDVTLWYKAPYWALNSFPLRYSQLRRGVIIGMKICSLLGF